MRKGFSIEVWWEQRVCACCGEPASDAHHIVARDNTASDDSIDNGLALCHGCHMRFHDADHRVQEKLGEALIRTFPRKLEHVRQLLGIGAADDYLRRYYRIGVPR